MIISKTPYRISFFGGGTDYPSWYLKNGGSVISTTIDKYIYISCRNLPPFFSHKYRIVWSKIETVKQINQIKHRAVKEMLKYYNVNEGLEIHYDGDLPARSGMGSSSVFIVGLLNLLSNMKNIKISKKNLAKKSIHFEQKILNEAVGSQDQIAATYGGLNKITFQKDGKFKVNPIMIKKETMTKLNNNLILVYTGQKRNAQDIAKGYIHKLTTNKKRQIMQISDYAFEGEKALRNGNLNDFGKLLHETWLQKKSLNSNVTNSRIDSIYSTAIKHGALGGKLLGAGGGGFLLFYSPQRYKKNIIKNLNKLLTIPFQFSSEGSTIMFKKLDTNQGK